MLLLFLPAIMICIEFIGFIFIGRGVVHNGLVIFCEIISLIIMPLIYAGFGHENVCCVDEMSTPAFSPRHQLTMGIIILICLLSYFFSRFRKRISTPLIELLINVFLVIGISLNIVLIFHTKESMYIYWGILPIILLFILMLVKNQRLFLDQSIETVSGNFGKMDLIVWNILSSKAIIKFPLILILCLPVLVLLSSFLLIFGQKPDSMIRAFTDTYKHGFSQWDQQCDNVECGGHYLCSVAAKGHKKIVQPQRLGIRNGGIIVCNRQLLISNAFEDLVHESFPYLHRVIRNKYDKVGDLVHKYYYIFDNKYVSDIVYVIMKPLEWFFLFTLYLFDRKPENRIAKQYLSSLDRAALENK